MLIHADGLRLREVVRSGGIVIVDFWAPGCAPCMYVDRIIEELSGRYPEVVFVKVDVSRYPEVAAEFDVRGIPTVMVFRDGRLVEVLTGTFGRPRLESVIRGLLNA